MTLDCDLPAYIGRPPRRLPVTGVMQVPMGSRVTVHAAVNKDLLGVHVDSHHRRSTGAEQRGACRRDWAPIVAAFATRSAR